MQKEYVIMIHKMQKVTLLGYNDDTPDNWGNNWAGDGDKFGMWQYTKENNNTPIPGNVDCDVAYKNYPLIIKSLHLNNFK